MNDDVTTLLSDLIRYPSVSRDSNVAISEFLAERLTRSGFQVERIPYADAAGVAKLNLAARRRDVVTGRPADRRGLAYFGHTDVVPADEWTGPGEAFEATVQAARLYGRGSVDMKGSIAAMITAAERTPSEGPVYVFLTADEEAGMAGADAVASRSELFAEAVTAGVTGIIGEPTQGRIVHGHKGVAVYDVVAAGIAGHSSTAAGESATLKLIPFLAEVRRLADELECEPRYRDDRYSPATPRLNVILRDTAPALNVTSASCACRVLIRVSPDLPVAEITERLRDAARVEGLDFRHSDARGAMFRPADSPVIQDLTALTGGEATTVPYGTDGCCFGAMNRLAVLGPGNIEQAHTSDEFISLDDLHDGVRLFSECIHRFAG